MGRGVSCDSVMRQEKGTHVDDAPVLLLAHDGPYGLGAGVGALDVDFLDNVPLLVGHRLERLVAEDSGIVDQDVDALPLAHGLLDNLGSLGRAVVVGEGFRVTRGVDVGDDAVGVFAREVVDDDVGAARGVEERVRAAESTAGACHDHDLVIKAELRGRSVLGMFISLGTGWGGGGGKRWLWNFREAGKARWVESLGCISKLTVIVCHGVQVSVEGKKRKLRALGDLQTRPAIRVCRVSVSLPSSTHLGLA